MTPEAIKEIIQASGGQIVGKTRLQKTAYLLEAAGIGYGFEFNYHYYGPYSEDLATAAHDAQALGLIVTNPEASSTLTYRLSEEIGRPTSDPTYTKRQAFLAKLKNYDTTALELAATADFLAKNGFKDDPWSETKRRKSIKASEERIAQAKRLLTNI